jgi:DNA polymerase-1
MASTALFIDGYSLIYRAFYALPPLSSPQGRPVNAVYGFLRILRRLIAEHSPEICAVVFDLGKPAKRLAILASYKAQRPPTPLELEAQLPVIREFLDAWGVPVVEVPEEEADDVIATLAARAAASGYTVRIASNDKDFMQLVGDTIQLVRPEPKGGAALCDANAVRARYGVGPGQIVDYLCLVGDSSDNISGVPGIGEKTAAKLLQTLGTLDALIENPSRLDKPQLAEKIAAHADQLRRNRQLIRLETDLALPVEPGELTRRPADAARLASLCRQCGFKSLLNELAPRVPAEERTPDLFGNANT